MHAAEASIASIPIQCNECMYTYFDTEMREPRLYYAQYTVAVKKTQHGGWDLYAIGYTERCVTCQFSLLGLGTFQSRYRVIPYNRKPFVYSVEMNILIVLK